MGNQKLHNITMASFYSGMQRSHSRQVSRLQTAPCFRSDFTGSNKPNSTASCKEARPFSSMAFGSAPWTKSSSMMSLRPVRKARCRGVVPFPLL